MSEEAVKKTITGTCAEVSERGDWTTFAIDAGTQYPVKLSTKLPLLVEVGRVASKDGGVFDWTYSESESEKINERSGKPYVNRYLEAVEPAGTSPVASVSPSTAPKDQDALSKDEWARKDSAAWKRMLIESAADALKHTIPAEPTKEDLTTFLAQVSTLTLAWHRSVLAERDDPTGMDVPF